MAALLRSGKFLRLVSGIARNNNNNTNVPGNGAASAGGGSVPGAANANPGGLPPGSDQTGLIPPVDYIGSFQAWSLQHLENALPTITGSNQQQQQQQQQEQVRS